MVQLQRMFVVISIGSHLIPVISRIRLYIWVMYGSCMDYVSYMPVEFLELINALGLTAYHQETPSGGTTITQTNQFLTTALI